MNNHWGLLTVGLTLIVIGGALVLVLVPAPQTPIDVATSTNATSTEEAAGIPDLIVVDSPKPGDVISSTTITITGKARGSWYFEGVFPIEINNFGGTTIAQGQAHAVGEWTTNDFVPFTATLTIKGLPTEPMGATIYLRNDNPSGDPAKQKEINFDVTFQ